MVEVGAWFLIVCIGMVIGSIVNFVTRHLEMPYILNVGLGIIGALLGAGLNRMVGVEILGPSSFYLSGAVVAVCISAGSVLAYSITFNERDRAKDSAIRRAKSGV